MKIAWRVGIGLGISSFLFATYTAVTGPAMLPDTEQENAATRERMAKIQASVASEQAKEGGGCCAKKEAKTAKQEEHPNCSHGAGSACPSNK